MLNNIKWLFFDVGSTLVDETDCYNHRIQDAIAGTNITFEEFNEKRMFFSKKNLKGDIEALRFFGLFAKEDTISVLLQIRQRAHKNALKTGGL